MATNGELHDTQLKIMYDRLTVNRLGRVFYAFNTLQGVIADPGCPDPLRARVREAAEALREHLSDRPGTATEPPRALLTDLVPCGG